MIPSCYSKEERDRYAAECYEMVRAGKFATVEEYAKAHGLHGRTVRQWVNLRYGRIRQISSAAKEEASLVKIGKASANGQAAGIVVEYYGAVIRIWDAAMLPQVLEGIRNAAICQHQ